MESSMISKGRYKYVHDVKMGPPEAIDIHHIIFESRGSGRDIAMELERQCPRQCTVPFRRTMRQRVLILKFTLHLGRSLCTDAFCRHFIVEKTMSFSQLLTPDNPVSIVLWSFTFASLLVRQLLRKQVEKGTVIILPAFGIQLETSYRSGMTVRRFVPMGKILKPVLNECLTPVTCYWSLSLILRGEEELLLVFKELYPPVTMLVPIWKAVCSAINGEKRTPKQ